MHYIHRSFASTVLFVCLAGTPEKLCGMAVRTDEGQLDSVIANATQALVILAESISESSSTGTPMKRCPSDTPPPRLSHVSPIYSRLMVRLPGFRGTGLPRAAMFTQPALVSEVEVHHPRTDAHTFPVRAALGVAILANQPHGSGARTRGAQASATSPGTHHP